LASPATIGRCADVTGTALGLIRGVYENCKFDVILGYFLREIQLEKGAMSLRLVPGLPSRRPTVCAATGRLSRRVPNLVESEAMD